jgi:hypothetical protein
METANRLSVHVIGRLIVAFSADYLFMVKVFPFKDLLPPTAQFAVFDTIGSRDNFHNPILAKVKGLRSIGSGTTRVFKKLDYLIGFGCLWCHGIL